VRRRPELVIDEGDGTSDVLTGPRRRGSLSLVLMNREPELDSGGPEELVSLVIVRLDGMIGRNCREHHASDGVMAAVPIAFQRRQHPHRSGSS